MPARNSRLSRSPPSDKLSLGLKATPEARLHYRPVVVDHGVPRRVAALAAADEHVLAEDALELRRQGGEGGARAIVAGVGLELHPQESLVLERVLHQQELRLG